MQRTRRLSLRALAVILLAALAAIVPAQADEQPPTPPDPWAGLTYAVRERAAAEARWYATLSAANERAAVRAQRRAAPARDESAPARVDGDRFDRLAQCESGADPTTDTHNGFLGAFQFVLDSWHAAGGTGSPVEHSYAEQKAVAMRWAAMTNPARQWPVCWLRSG